MQVSLEIPCKNPCIQSLRASKLAAMRITESALKRGYKPADLEHALRNYLKAIPADGFVMFVGPTTTGLLLEVGYREDTDTVFHAMPVRSKFWP